MFHFIERKTIELLARYKKSKIVLKYLQFRYDIQVSYFNLRIKLVQYFSHFKLNRVMERIFCKAFKLKCNKYSTRDIL